MGGRREGRGGAHPGEGDAGGVHGAGGGHGRPVAQQHDEAGQAVEEGGGGGGRLLEEEDAPEGPLRGQRGASLGGGGDTQQGDPPVSRPLPSPPSAHLAVELGHAVAALDVEPHRQPHALVAAVVAAAPACGRGRLQRPPRSPSPPSPSQPGPPGSAVRPGPRSGEGVHWPWLGTPPTSWWGQAGHPGSRPVAPSNTQYGPASVQMVQRFAERPSRGQHLPRQRPVGPSMA